MNFSVRLVSRCLDRPAIIGACIDSEVAPCEQRGRRYCKGYSPLIHEGDRCPRRVGPAHPTEIETEAVPNRSNAGIVVLAYETNRSRTLPT
jgi:hypothetical protein